MRRRKCLGLWSVANVQIHWEHEKLIPIPYCGKYPRHCRVGSSSRRDANPIRGVMRMPGGTGVAQLNRRILVLDLQYHVDSSGSYLHLTDFLKCFRSVSFLRNVMAYFSALLRMCSKRNAHSRLTQNDHLSSSQGARPVGQRHVYLVVGSVTSDPRQHFGEFTQSVKRPKHLASSTILRIPFNSVSKWKDASNPFRVIHPTQVHVEGYVMSFMDKRAMTHLKQKMNNLVPRHALAYWWSDE